MIQRMRAICLDIEEMFSRLHAEPRCLVWGTQALSSKSRFSKF